MDVAMLGKYLENEFHKAMYFTSNGCELMNRVQEMITMERIAAKKERKQSIPGCLLQIVDDKTIGAFVTKIDTEYCIFINKGVIEEQKLYLERHDWSFISDGGLRKKYLDDMIEYGFYFMVFHEYIHIYCGHVDAGLNDAADKKAQEYEADILSMDYLMNYVLCKNSIDDYMEEFEKLFLAIYFLFEKMQKQNSIELYDNKLLSNYYEVERKEKRDHPLDAQRIIYLFEMLNIFIKTDKVQMMPIKENILDKLKRIKRLSDVDFSGNAKFYPIVDESVRELEKSLQEIRRKIPRKATERV